MKAFLIAAALAFASLGSAGAAEAIATISFADGLVSVSRDGSKLEKSGIGDDIYDGDLISTGSVGAVTLQLGKATGMSGSIKVASKTSFYFNIKSIKGENRGQAELIAGQISLKMKKLAGSPTFDVDAENATCAVRGTEFDVIASPGGSILVACAEGEVECASEGVSTSAVPGQAVEKREGVRIARRTVAAADYENFKRKWIEGEAAAFKRDAPKAARRIAANYLDLAQRLAANQERISASGAVKAWVEEERKGGAGVAISKAELDRRLAEAEPLLKESRLILGTMERVAARVTAIKEAIDDDPTVLSQEIRPGRTVGDFFSRFEAARDRDLQRIAALRRTVRLVERARSERERIK